MIIVNGFQPLTIIEKRSILDVAAALDPPLELLFSKLSHMASPEFLNCNQVLGLVVKYYYKQHKTLNIICLCGS